MNNSRTVIGSLHQFIALAKKEPSLLNIGGLHMFRSLVTVTPSQGCSKCSNLAAKISGLQKEFEAAMAVLNTTEQQRLKVLLRSDSVCYYKTSPNGQLKPVCF